MAGVSSQRVREDFGRLLHEVRGVREYSLRAARILRRAVPFEGVCVLTMDPATLVATGEVVETGLSVRAITRMAEIEQRGEDFNAFRALAHSRTHVATLTAATGGDLQRSERHREIRVPHGMGDELRAALVDDDTMWGALTLLRGADCDPFSAHDVALVAEITAHLAEGLRRALLLAEDNAEPSSDAAGVLILAPDGSPAFADERAAAWLDERDRDGALSRVVTAVATRARLVAAGEAHDDRIARARVRTASGCWLVVRASALGDGHIAVMMEPAAPHELAPLVADAYGLSEREREVTELVAIGLPTDAIAARLHLSPWTVQDHLKAIFEKVEVATRGELVARVFFNQHAPRLN